MARLWTNLRKVAGNIPEAAQRALLQTGKDILELSQQLVPVDTSSLKKSGGVVPVSSETIQIGYGGEGIYFDRREPAKYAKHVEFGTSRASAQPFLTPAFAQSEDTFKARLTEELKKLEGVS